MIKNYDDFLRALLAAGFSMASGNDEGILALVPFNWNQEPPDSPIVWHTGDPDSDPWEWRMRVLLERDDIAYSKFFLKKGGFLTKEWYPYFLAARRQGRSFAEQYQEGSISYEAKQIYDVISREKALPSEEIKRLAGFGKENKAAFDRALIDLQMKLFITMCGQRQKVNLEGMPYGWSSSLYCTVEEFFPQEVFDMAGDISPAEAVERISAQVLRLNPQAKANKIRKFILG